MNHTCCMLILTHASYGKTYNLLFLLVTGQVLYQCSGRTGWSGKTLFFHVGICHFCVVPFLSIRILTLYIVIHKHLYCSCLLDEHINSLTRLRLLPIIFCTVSAIDNHSWMFYILISHCSPLPHIMIKFSPSHCTTFMK